MAAFAANLLVLLFALLASAFSANAQSIDSFTFNPTTFTQVGDTINYSVVFSTQSRVIYTINPITTNAGVVVTCPAIPAPPTGLQPPASITCTGSYHITATEMTAGTFNDDIANVTGTQLGGGGVFNTSFNGDPLPTATRIGGGPVNMTVDASPNPTTPGTAVTVTATVSSSGCNAGNIPVQNVTLTVGSQSFSAPLVKDFPAASGGTATHTFASGFSAGSYAVSASYPGGSGCSSGTVTGSNLNVDTPPTVTINQAGGQADPTGSSPILFSVVFNKTVTGFSSSSDITIGGTAGATTASISGSGQNYTVSVSGMTQSGTVTASIPAGKAFSSFGVGNSASTSNDNTVTYRIIAVSPTSLPNPTFNQSYNQTVSASGGAGPYTFNVTNGSLPNGLTLSSGGTLSGTPVAGGAFSFRITATDADGITGFRNYSFNIAAPTITVSPTSLPSVDTGTSYSQNITASGAVGPYDFTVTGGSLPPGLTLAIDGTLSGTPTTANTYNFDVTATDTISNYTGVRSYSLVITTPPIVVSPNSLPAAAVMSAYSQSLSASGTVGPYSFAATGGELPAGLTLASDGTLSGTPTGGGPFSFTVTVTDSTTPTHLTVDKVYSLTVNPPTIAVSPTSLPAAAVAASYSQSISATGGTGSHAFQVTGGSLPAGLTLATDGTLSGTPTAGGSFNFTITATDQSTGTGPYAGSRAYTLTVNAPTVTVSPTTLPNATVAAAYSQGITASGGTGSHSFQVTAGTLPAGLTLSTNGTLSGTPTAGGSFNFDITATDQSTGTGPYTGTRSYSLTVAAPTLAIAPTSLPGGTGGTAYAQTLTASGGTASYSFLVTSGSLPTGLTLSSGGSLSGMPTVSGTFNFTVTATDSSTGTGPYTVDRAYSLSIDAPTITLSPASPLPDADGGVAYSKTISATGGVGPHSFDVTAGSLPAGLTLATNGTLSGTPTASGNFTFTVTATDQNAFTGDRAYALRVTAPTITLSPASPLPSGTAGVSYSGATLTASGGAGQHAFSVTLGSLPPGLTLSSGGVLSGTPTATGTFNFTATATDQNGFTGSQAYALTVNGAPIAFTSASSLSAPGGAALTFAVAANSAAGALSYDIQSGTLPAGLILAADGTLSGTPTQGGIFSLLFRATDAYGFSNTQQFALTIIAPTITLSPTSPLPDANGGVAYSQTFSATGGKSPHSFAVTAGTLPSGLSLNSAGVLSGTPTAGGTFNFTIEATDTDGFTGDQAYALTVIAPTITLSPTSLPSINGGTAYSQTLTASGGKSPHTFAVTAGTLPTGLSLSSTGVISGTPSAGGTFNFTVTATDADGFKGDQAYSLIVIKPNIEVLPKTLPTGNGGTVYTQNLTGSGGTAPYTFAVTGGALPPGLSLGPDGVWSGAPSAPGTYSFAITVTDAKGFTATLTYKLVIAAPRPVVLDKNVELLAGATGRVSLTEGATGGPFTVASIVGISDPSAGTVTIDRSGGSFDLVFVSDFRASGAVAVTYTLSNKWGASKPATVTFNIIARPDPSKDPEVTALINAQIAAAKKLADAQIQNFNDRLEQLHNDADRQAGSVGVQVGFNDQNPDSNGNSAALGFAEDGKPNDPNSARFGFPMLEGGNEGAVARKAVFWAGGYVNFGRRDNGSIAFDDTLAGVSGGVDYRFSSKFVGGIGLGYGRDAADIGDNGTENHATALSAAIYGSYHPMQDIFLDGLLGYSKLDFDSRRFVIGTGAFASGERDGQQVFGSITAAYEKRQDNWLVSPYGRIEASWTQLDGFTETGAGAYNLTYDEQTVSTLSGVLGIRAEYGIPVGWGLVKARARAEYTHDFAGSSRASMGYADLANGFPYSFDVEAFDRDYIGLGVGLETTFQNGWLLGMDYNAALSFNGDSQDHRVAAKIGAKF